MKRVLVPPHPGLFSALGLLVAQIEQQGVRTCMRRAASVDAADLARWYAALEEEALSILAEEGSDPGKATIARLADLRYAGQAFELTVPAGGAAATVGEMVQRFEAEHLRTYGHRADSDAVDLVSVRVIAQGRAHAAIPVPPAGAARESRTREAYFGPAHGLVRTPVIDRSALAGRRCAGPLIVEEYDATCVIPPGGAASLDDRHNIVIDLGEVR